MSLLFFPPQQFAYNLHPQFLYSNISALRWKCQIASDIYRLHGYSCVYFHVVDSLYEVLYALLNKAIADRTNKPSLHTLYI